MNTVGLFEKDEFNKYYSVEEKQINQNLLLLFEKWMKQMPDLPNSYTKDDFLYDGFYPNYLTQKYKILFIGREALGLRGCYNYIEILHNFYLKGIIGKKLLNKHLFHSRMLKVVYGLNNSIENPKELPKASDIIKTSNIGFAFMNLSKFSNESTSWKADWNLIKSFVDNSSRKFYMEEVNILNPDLIITMNLGEDYLSLFGDCTSMCSEENILYYQLKNNGKIFNLMDMWHYSSRKSFPNKIYRPLIQMIDKYNCL